MDVRILGTLEVIADECPVDLGLRKARMLFGALALQSGIPVPFDRLAEAVWPSGPPARWENALYSHVSRLRRALEPERAARTPSRRIETAGDAYVLRLGPDELDAQRFERLAVEGRAALGHGSPERASELLDAALAQWRGPVLADLADAPFVATEARRFEELRLVVVEERIEAELALGRHAAAVADLERLVTEHPLRERGWELLLLALYRSGRQSDALRRYQEVRAILGGELGIEPGPGLRELESSILQHDDGLQRARAHVVEVAAESLTVAPPSWLRPAVDTFVGRVSELDTIRGEWERVIGGERRLVVVAGEPGIGKTRLVREACIALARDGALVLGGRCAEEPLHALEPFAEALGRLALAHGALLAAHAPHEVAMLAGLVPELSEHAGPRPIVDTDEQRYLVFRAVSTVLDARVLGAPVLLVVDDVQWAAAASVQLLEHLLRDDDRGPLLVVVTARDTEPNAKLDALIAAFQGERRLQRLSMRGLAPEDVGRLAIARGSDAGAEPIYEMTEGNPFFVEELVRHVAESGGVLEGESVPDSVRDTIARRLIRLPDGVRRLLGVGAITGLQFDLDVVAAADSISVEDADDALALAERAGVLGEVSGTVGTYTFSHALIRHVLRDGLGTARRARLHRRVGEAIVATHPERAAQIAYHLLEAAADGSDPIPGVEHAREASRQAAARFAYDDAVAVLEAALARLAPAGDSALHCELLMDLAESLGRVSRYREIPALDEEAYQMAARLDEPELVGFVLSESFHDWLFAPAVWIERVDAVLERLADTSPRRILLTATLARYWSRRQGARGRELGEWALARVQSVAARDRHLVFEFAFLSLNAWSPAERMVDIARAQVDAARDAGTRAAVVAALGVLRRAYLGVGDLARSDEAGREYESEVDALRQPRLRAVAEQRRAMRALLAGRFAEAEVHAEEAAKLQPSAVVFEGFAVQLFALRYEQGRLDELRRLIDVWAGPDAIAAWRLGLGVLLAEVGEHDGARDALRPSVAVGFSDVARDDMWFVSMSSAASIACAIGDTEAAALVYEILLPHSSRVMVAGDGAVCWGSTHRILGPLAALLGHVDRASMHFEAATAVHERLGAQPFLARDRLGHARLLRDSGGDPVRVHNLARTGLAIARQLDMRNVIERFEDLA